MNNTNSLSSDAVTIVYAQPVLSSKEQDIGTGKDNVRMSNSPKNQPSVPIIQRKEDSSQIKSVQQDNRTIAVQNLTDLSSSHLSDETSLSEISVVSPQPISEELVNTSTLPLQAKFIDSNTSSATPADKNQNIESSSRVEGTKIIESTSRAEIPVVSPLLISRKLVNNSSMSLAEELTTRSEKQLPIIQGKEQNSSLSPSSLPMVNPLNTVVAIIQTQQDNNYSTKRNSIKPINLKSQRSLNNLPIATTQPLTSQVNFTEKKISFARDAPNYQKQSFNISKSDIKPSNRNQNLYPFTTPIASPMDSKLKSQPLPLAKNRPKSNSISQEPNLSNQNSKGTNTNSVSSPRILANPAPKTETYVSTMTNQSNSKIDVDAIANKVERKIMRRLVIESERRGKVR